MSSLSVEPPYPVFEDTDGQPLDEGYIYIGTAGTSAEANAISIYWDATLTIPAAQPVRTSGGYAMRAGSPANIYVAGDYSITIKDKNSVFVYGALNVTQRVNSATFGGTLSVANGGTGGTTQATALVSLGAFPNDTFSQSTNYTIISSDRGRVVVGTSTWTLALTSAVTLGDGFCFALNNAGAGIITINPAGAETIDGSATLEVGPGESCIVVSTGAAWVTVANNAAFEQTEIQIQPIGATVATNALTVTLNPTVLNFRSTSLDSGTVTNLILANAITLVAPTGATFGTTSAVKSRIAVLAINNAGTIVIGLCNIGGGIVLTEDTLINTAAINGSSTSATTIYSGSALTSVAFRVVGYIESTQATAGTWATAPSTVQGAGGEAFTGMSSVGYGQTWQSVTRTASVAYYNTTGKPIFGQCWGVGGGALGQLDIIVGGVQFPLAQVSLGTGFGASFLVPPGMTYQFIETNLASRSTAELR